MAGTAAVASGIIEMLKEDHEKVKGLFEDFESAEGREQADIAATAIMELEVHVLIKELKKLKPKDEVFQAKFKVLGELVKHHIEEEEGQILPKAQESEIDWDKLETTVMKRRETMTNKLAGQKKASKR
jgi:uncharacterized protein YecA (UPF0149 family)